MRERDPLTVDLIKQIIVYQPDWPETAQAYASALETLADRCQAKAGKAELFRWIKRELSGWIRAENSYITTSRTEAVPVFVCQAPERFEKMRAKLSVKLDADPGFRPNFQSMIAYAIGRLANDLYQSTEGRHKKREVPMSEATTRFGGIARTGGSHNHWLCLPQHTCQPDTATLARQVVAIVQSQETGIYAKPARAFLAVLQGEPVAQVARRTGYSRQQLYRAWEEVQRQFREAV